MFFHPKLRLLYQKNRRKCHMKHRNLWQLLSSLSSREADKFIRWLQFELGESQKYVQKLAACLVKKISNNLSEQDVWDHLYPNQAYNDPRLRKLMRDTMRYLEEFLAIEAFLKDQDQKDISLLKEVHRRNRPELFQKMYRRQERSLEQLPMRNAKYFRKRYEMEGVYQHYLIQHKPKERYTRQEAYHHSFNCWWMLGKMEMACIQIFRPPQTRDAPEDLLLKEVMTYISEARAFQQIDALEIYRALYLLLNGEADLDTKQIRSLLRSHGHQLSVDELRTIFGLLINFHTKNYNLTNSESQYEELFHLYEWGIQEKLVLQDQLINLNHYKNIQSICLRLKKFDKARHYLDMFRPHLPKGIGESAYVFNLCTYLFALKEYPQVIELLRTTRFQNLMFEIPARVLLIQTHYERSGPGQEWLLTQVDSLTRFIRQQNIPQNNKRPYLNFLSIMGKMIKILMPDELQKLDGKLKQTTPVYQSYWLNRKMSERLVNQPL